MLEYASIRLTLDCDTATMFPATIEVAATTASTSRSAGCVRRTAGVKMRRNPANAAAFPPVDMKALTVVGAPSYTSGTHM